MKIICSRKSTKKYLTVKIKLGNVRMWLETVVNSDKLSVKQ